MRVYTTEKDSMEKILARKMSETKDVSSVVEKIIQRVRTDGDQALFQLVEEIDQVKLGALAVSAAEKKPPSKRLHQN